MIELRGLVKRFQRRDGDGGRVNAVDRLDLDIPDGEFVTLLGPSGCGKTTTLRMIAGLERPDVGEIVIDGDVVYSGARGVFVRTHRRSIGMVFQSYAIWPHMTVLENVAFPLIVGRHHLSRAASKQRAMELLELVNLAELADRPAPDLSGGQQQRVALARALVREPRVLLLDEPLSNLDAGLRDQMGVELRAVQRRLGVTTVFVTHDQGEALSMSDVVVVMNEGRLVERGTPREIYGHPNNAFTASFMGVCNVLKGVVSSVSGTRAEIDIPAGKLRCEIRQPVDRADGVHLFMHPQSFQVSQDVRSDRAWAGTVESGIYHGEFSDYQVRVGDQQLKVRLYGEKVSLLSGDKVWVEPDENAALVTRVTPVLSSTCEDDVVDRVEDTMAERARPAPVKSDETLGG